MSDKVKIEIDARRAFKELTENPLIIDRVLPTGEMVVSTKQDYETPQEFVNLVAYRFGAIFSIDLAARDDNRKAGAHLGPGSEIADGEDALSYDWNYAINLIGDEHHAATGWLNPPFRNVTPWMQKCVDTKAAGGRVIALVLASVGSNWYQELVAPHAQVYALSPRVTFVGEKLPFNKDLILADFRPGFGPSFATWRWKR